MAHHLSFRAWVGAFLFHFLIGICFFSPFYGRKKEALPALGGSSSGFQSFSVSLSPQPRLVLTKPSEQSSQTASSPLVPKKIASSKPLEPITAIKKNVKQKKAPLKVPTKTDQKPLRDKKASKNEIKKTNTEPKKAIGHAHSKDAKMPNNSSVAQAKAPFSKATSGSASSSNHHLGIGNGKLGAGIGGGSTGQAVTTELAEEIALLQEAIVAKWVRPIGVSEGLKCILEVWLNLEGEVQSVKLLRSSSETLFDRSAELAIRNASPLPMPQNPHLLKEFLHFRFTFSPEEENL